MKILFKDEENGKNYVIKQEIIDLTVFSALILLFILAVSFIQNISILWGVATW